MVGKSLAIGIILLFLFNNISFTTLCDDNSGNLSGKKLYVGGNGEGNYTRIQDAIDDASDGDTVYVYSGIYYERLLISKKLFLRSIDTGEGSPIVDANQSGPVIKIKGNGCIIDGFIAKDAGSEFSSTKAGFIVAGRNCTIRNSECRGSSYTGIYITTKFSANNAQIINNTISADINGIYLPYEPLGGCEDILISGNSIYGTPYAIELNAGSNFTITNNKICSNKRGILFRFGGNHYIIGNNISDNDMYGIATVCTNYNELKYYIKDNVINNNKAIGIELKETYLSEIENNEILNNGQVGIFLTNSNYNRIFKNEISQNRNDGIYFNNSNYNEILNNSISNNFRDGVEIYYSNDNLIRFNILEKNNRGVHLFLSEKNLIHNNNFLKNNINSFFYGSYIYENNEWLSNYWNRPRLLPKPIFGIGYFVPWLEFDLNPASEPYDIEI
jgi:parallel beta-helix repeat protein